MPKEELLEVLADRKGCYISSLRNQMEMNDNLRVLQQINLSEYGLEEWNDCLSYLTGREVSLQSKDDVKRYLEDTVITDDSGY